MGQDAKEVKARLRGEFLNPGMRQRCGIHGIGVYKGGIRVYMAQADLVEQQAVLGAIREKADGLEVSLTIDEPPILH